MEKGRLRGQYPKPQKQHTPFRVRLYTVLRRECKPHYAFLPQKNEKTTLKQAASSPKPTGFGCCADRLRRYAAPLPRCRRRQATHHGKTCIAPLRRIEAIELRLSCRAIDASRRPTMEKPVSPHCVESKLLSFASTQADRRFTAYRTNTPREALPKIGRASCRERV